MPGMRVRLIGWTHFEPPDDVDWSTDAEGGQALAEFAGRACYQSWTKPNPATATNAGYLRHILDANHMSVLEHGTATVYVTGVSRSLTHELVRHRHLSYSQLSQRYVSERYAEMVEPDIIAADPGLHATFMRALNAAQEAYTKLADGLLRKLQPKCPHCAGPLAREQDPAGWWCLVCQARPAYPAGAHHPALADDCGLVPDDEQVYHCGVCGERWPCASAMEDPYNPTTIRKQARQAARAVLPNATETRIVVTGNYRAWRHFVTMRASEHADVEIRALAVACLGELNRIAPNVFGDFITYNLTDGTVAVRTVFRGRH